MSASRHWISVYDELGLDWLSIPEVPQKTLSDYIEEYARSFRDRVALEYHGERYSYGYINQCANKLAHLWSVQGCHAGDVVGIQMPNTPQYVIALIAAARMGLVVTSLSPLLTAKETYSQCCDAEINVLFILDSLYSRIERSVEKNIPTLRTVILSGMAEMLPGQSGASVPVGDSRITVLQLKMHLEKPMSDAPVNNKQNNTTIDTALYLQYTGGTTGKSKGAELTSRNLFTNNIQANVFYKYRQGMEVVASAFPFFHIGGLAVLMNSLRTASTLLIIPDPRNITHYCQTMKNNPPTVLANVPTLYQMLMAEEEFCSLDFSGLRVAISGAAPFPKESINRLEEIIGEGRYCEVYGMTETSPVQTINPAERFKPGFVGIPLPGTDLRIVDSENEDIEMPCGESGEIVVSGPQVMRGYQSNLVETSKVLKTYQDKVWMHTGDIGYLDEEGYLKICDRSKDMLIVGGFKVFSIEVENKLQELPFVEMCAVVGKPDIKRPGNDVVQVYVQSTKSTRFSEPEQTERIVEFCRQNLSPYKVPKEIHFVREMPLTSVGKIDKKSMRVDQRNTSKITA
ncbi:AMP-binding protein [Gammaproteobacteria bacterium 45_16_T64]|nr:AMP-binding protein [Gammaproteobacteria bacterium 45_16_T64]